MELRSPTSPLPSGMNFGTRNNEMPRVPAGASGRRASTRCRMFSAMSCSRSEEHTSELQSLMRSSYAVFCLKQKKHTNNELPTYTLTQEQVQHIGATTRT